MNIFKRWVEKEKQELSFELKHKKFFIGLYARVIILCLLVAIAVYYKTAQAICWEHNGTITQDKDSLFKVKCEGYKRDLPPEPPIFIENYKYNPSQNGT